MKEKIIENKSKKEEKKGKEENWMKIGTIKKWIFTIFLVLIMLKFDIFWDLVLVLVSTF